MSSVIGEFEYIIRLPKGSRRPRVRKNKRKPLEKLLQEYLGKLIGDSLMEQANRPGFARRMFTQQ